MFVWFCPVVLLVSYWLVRSWFARFCEGFPSLPIVFLVVVFVHLLFATGTLLCIFCLPLA
jgi:hypothetical protein